MTKTFATILLLLTTVGCKSYETRMYDVTVKNDAASPITIWLSKDGPPYEQGWMAPEEIAIQSPKAADQVIGGVIVPEGKTAETGPLKGQFEPGTHAVLRVYAGELKFNELLARSRGAGNRFDLKLAPGKSSFVVSGNASVIEVKQAESP